MVLDGVTVSSETRHNFFLACRHELVANPSRKGSQLQTVAQSIRVKSCRSYIGFNGYPKHTYKPRRGVTQRRERRASAERAVGFCDCEVRRPTLTYTCRLVSVAVTASDPTLSLNPRAMPK